MTPTVTVSDVRGISRIVIDAITGVTGIVEDMHRNIAGISPVIGAAPTGSARGISGVVYRSVRGITRAVGVGLEVILARLPPLLEATGSTPRRDAVVAALNGILGDYLVASGNSLAIPMQLRVNGEPLSLETKALAPAFGDSAGKLIVLVHGLCMSDRGWERVGHDHGAKLAGDLGGTALYLFYNTGRHISENGREFAGLLERLLKAWPVPVTDLVIIGHSMGGLVAHSACHYAKLARQPWLSKLKTLIFLGTPHHGAPLERAGSWIDLLLGVSPYTAPFARLGGVRSAGIKDLRHGYIADEDWAGAETKPAQRLRKALAVPGRVKCFAIAGTTQAPGTASMRRLPGDGLVPVKSALGQHRDAALTLPIPMSHQYLCYATNHLDLLSSRDVCARLRTWLEKR